jgi:membrane fusion protein (multidrug efflux system)
MAAKKYLIVAIVGIGVAGGGAWWYQNIHLGARPGSPVAIPGAPPAAAPPQASGSAPGGAPTWGQGAGRPAGAGADGANPSLPSGAGPRGPGAGGGAGGGPAAVEVARAEVVRLEDDSQAVGSLKARQSVTLRPEVSGRIRGLGFVDGQRVRQGQLLLQLDDTLQQAQLKQAEAAASIARTNLQRSRELAAQNFVSQSAVDQNAAALEVALAQVALAQAQIGRMRVVAPFDGIAGIRSASVGDYVKDGADIVAIEDLSSLVVDFRLPERYLPRLKTGQGVELLLDSLPGRTFSASVEAIDAQLDANGRSILVRARVANPDGALRGGMFARVRTVLAVRETAVVIPEEALVPMGGRQVVFRLEDGPDGGKIARRTPVNIGMRMPGKVEVLDGVSAQDQVVIAGQARLMRAETSPVRVVDVERIGAGRPGGPGGGRPDGAGRPGGEGGVPPAGGGRPGSDRPGPRPSGA